MPRQQGEGSAANASWHAQDDRRRTGKEASSRMADTYKNSRVDGIGDGGRTAPGRESWADASEAELDWREVDFVVGGVKGADAGVTTNLTSARDQVSAQ